MKIIEDLVMGLDFDDVLIHTNYVVREIVKKCGESLDYDWEFSGFKIETINRIKQFFNDPIAFNNIYLLDSHAKDILSEWAEHYKLIIITARASSTEMINQTNKMIEENLPMISEVYFVAPANSKAKLFKNCELDIWIDDSPTGCLTSKEMGIKTYMISNESTPYNYYLRDKINWVEGIEQINLLE
jgi:5'(3')-deoxyribonucleotidase